jgi:hypothetical protein
MMTKMMMRDFPNDDENDDARFPNDDDDDDGRRP